MDCVAVKRRYSDEERANALAALAANNNCIRGTAAKLGIPFATLAKWANGTRHPEAIIDGHEKKLDMATALENVAWKLLDAIPDKIAKAPLNQTATAMGIAIDKARLLRGQPTQITQHDLAQLTDDELDRRIKEAEARLVTLEAGESVPSGTAPDADASAILRPGDKTGLQSGVAS